MSSSPTICLHPPHNLLESLTRLAWIPHIMPESPIICQHLNMVESLTLCLHTPPYTNPYMTCLHPPYLGWISHDMLGLNIPYLYPHIPHMTCLYPLHDLLAFPTWMAYITNTTLASYLTCLHPPHDLLAFLIWLACIPHMTCLYPSYDFLAFPTLCLHPPHHLLACPTLCLHHPHVLPSSPTCLAYISQLTPIFPITC